MLHASVACSELPSYISTIGDQNIRLLTHRQAKRRLAIIINPEMKKIKNNAETERERKGETERVKDSLETMSE